MTPGRREGYRTFGEENIEKIAGRREGRGESGIDS